ncbi:hypothetical protein AGR1C_Cc10142 [Agrobacterium fabacearum TT111]|nr:hypothetical protein AGR1C_Cc10142 [Agrobacterium fabacearum TT111]
MTATPRPVGESFRNIFGMSGSVLSQWLHWSFSQPSFVKPEAGGLAY